MNVVTSEHVIANPIPTANRVRGLHTLPAGGAYAVPPRAAERSTVCATQGMGFRHDVEWGVV